MTSYPLSKLVEMQRGRRVRAAMDIIYAERGDEIVTGHEGVIAEVSCGGALASVLWDGETETRDTGFDALDLLGGRP